MSGQTRCHLLELPTELRLKIWSLLLTSPKKLPLRHEATLAHEIREAGFQPQMLRLNRLIHDEAIDILYGENTFWVGKHSDYDHLGVIPRNFERWVEKVGSTNLSKIKTLEVEVRSSLPRTVYECIYLTTIRLTDLDIHRAGFLNTLSLMGKVKTPDDFVEYPTAAHKVLGRMREERTCCHGIVAKDVLEIYQLVPTQPFRMSDWTRFWDSMKEGQAM